MAKTVKNSKSNNSAAADGKRSNDTRPKTKAKAQQSKASSKSTRGRADKSKAARPGEKKGFLKFLRDVRVEMKKVTWPTRRDLVQSTLVVLVAVTIVGFYIAFLDLVFSRAIVPVEKALTSILT